MLLGVSRLIDSERRDASTARVPAVPEGKAIVFTRYAEEKSVVMNPVDFHRLAELDRDLAAVTSGGVELSALALRAHSLEDTPGIPVEDPAEIAALLGL
jgi:hypothetical protein